MQHVVYLHQITILESYPRVQVYGAQDLLGQVRRDDHLVFTALSGLWTSRSYRVAARVPSGAGVILSLLPHEVRHARTTHRRRLAL